MATLKEPFALDRSLNTTEVTPRNIADVLAEGLSHITGRTASEVEYDNTESGLTADNVQDALDEINGKIPTVPSVDIQTAVDEFETYNGGLLSECKVSLSPNQDLHGYPEPWVGGAGKNKAPYTLANLITSNTSGTWNSNVYTIYGVEFTVYTDDGGNVIAIKANGQNNGNQSLFVLYFTLKDSNTYIVSGCPSGGASSTYEVYANLGNGSVYDRGSGAATTAVANYNGYVSIAIRAGYNAQNLMFYPMLRLSTESDPTFEPYTNICPISGHTQVEVDVSDGQTTQEQVTVNLGGTYYSGTLDVVSGVLTVDKKSVEYDGSADENWIKISGEYRYYIAKPVDISNNVNGTISNNFKFYGNQAAGVPDGQFYIGASNLGVRLDSITAIADWKTFLSNNPMMVVYPLDTPTPIQLSPTMVKALVGENHLAAPLDGQEITESKYKQMFTFDDVIAYIQSLS